MEIHYDLDLKILQVFVNHDDQDSPLFQKKMDAVLEEARRNRYFVSVFYSGNQDLYAATRDLLVRNWRASAAPDFPEKVG